ncbi:sensor histidine kinase [Chelativorans sp. M5D2P16]|uniref:sensor histidine kinase n=1 Tax=Chelativorans sp. M5D2P16 TaxID=3095678 RepID=UPI002ACA22ED|nr:sensor histidine kinase [Chelativorans sp. M5D2P16]MDZ5696485.1 sensor histidine kinase [Chelativorans sp. M5D2P16]
MCEPRAEDILAAKHFAPGQAMRSNMGPSPRRLREGWPHNGPTADAKIAAALPNGGQHETATQPVQDESAWLLQSTRTAVEEAIAQERLRIARDVHDHVGQHLVGITLRLAALEYRIQNPTLRASLSELRTIVGRFGEELKALSVGERCGVPSGATLFSALERLIGDWERGTGIRIEFDCRTGEDLVPSEAVAEAVYRVVQEALTNVAKHALTARRVTVRLTQHGRTLRLRIEDDGRGAGAPPAANSRRRGGWGIIGMRERVAALGGTLDVRRRAQRGMSVLANIPLELNSEQTWGQRQ